MTPEELHALKLEAMRPYRKRNMTLAVGLFAGVGAIFAYTMYMMRPDDFDRIENMDKYKK
nr:hypothetical protein HK105_002901 [Polyrhizophydium stewartii]